MTLAAESRRCGSRRGLVSLRFARNLSPSECSSPIAVGGSFRGEDGYSRPKARCGGSRPDRPMLLYVETWLDLQMHHEVASVHRVIEILEQE